MYNKIVEIFKQNGIPTENIFYRNELGTFILNGNESCDEFFISFDKGLSFLWIFQGTKERKFEIFSRISMPGLEAYSLKEINNE